MTTTVTHSDSGTLVWSPDGTRLAYATTDGLQAYINGPRPTDDETHLRLSDETFYHVAWSPDGRYLCATRADGRLFIYRFRGQNARLVHELDATTVEWLEADQLIYVPEGGGLVMVYLGQRTTEIKLAG